ncbi:HMG-Y-related protein B-like [Tripterygium wilfordii]|uniref:HMG-Y-related protein B-like n=1 Tax=Tripterygium wilfordii TaxID=458696 RepID=A0A7J7DP25_TRIWF|nr:HMG-Y-related protein B-like [Tripterygium wilfordii]KAF5748033.1 HMG-Y-related protein B-like [Tripterygium wilfordii]
METDEATNLQLLPPAPPQTQEQQQPSILPQYQNLIMAAIEALNDPNGSNKSAISKQIEDTYPDLPASHSKLLSDHLSKMKQIGQLVMVKNNYMKPDPNAPPKRGRGRPPKPKEPLPPGAELPPARPRGRPPKPRDPFAPAPPAKPKSSSSGTGRPRGRPPKRAKTAASAPDSGAVTRGRGRPPKVKPAVEPVGC